MSTENTRAEWDNVLQLPDNKMPKQNFEHELNPEELRYYLTHNEYNILLKAVQSLIKDYTEGGGGNPGGVDLDNKYLSKVTHDRAAGLITFLQGVKFQPTQEDANLNTGGIIESFGVSQYGVGHLRGLTLDEWLEVPELRFNRVEVSVGDFWRAAGGGRIESVEIDSVDTGIITLKVEEGEMGAISESDLCLGIYHFLGDGEEPAPENSEVEIEDGKGNRAVKGFASIYFTITEILTEELVEGEMVPVPINTKFRYKLRPTNSTTFLTQHHPQPFMSFVAYGNSDDTKKHRQNSSYQTKTYERFLVNVNDWEYGDANIAAQFGDLSNISHIVGEHDGYSIYLNNVYFAGNLQQLKSTTLTAVLSNPNVPISVTEGRKDLSNTQTNLQVYEGDQELQYIQGTEVDLTEGTYSVSVDTIAINRGLITSSGTFLQMGICNDMREDSATIIFNITGKRINGKKFSLAIHQNFYVAGVGKDGQDGTLIKWIYTRTKKKIKPDIPTDANLNTGASPQWTDTPVGPDHEYRYEWASKKESFSLDTWSNYTLPALWSNYSYDGSDGKDGKSVEFVYNRSNNSVIPPDLIDVEDRTLDENYPGGISAIGETWSDDPRGVDPTHSVEWVSKRVKKDILQEAIEGEEPKYISLWGDYSAPAIWAKFSFNGKDGEDGSGVQVKGAFDTWEELDTVVAPERGDGYLILEDLWVYDGVSPAVVDVSPFGWSNVGKIAGKNAYFHIAYADSVISVEGVLDTIKGFSENDYAHKAWLGTYADHTKASAGETDWKKYNWVLIKGSDGPGQEYIYKLMDRAPTLDEEIPVKSIDDNSDDNVPEGWSDDPQGHTPELPYEWTSIRKKKDGIWGPYTKPVAWTNYSKPGDPGAAGIPGADGPAVLFRGPFSLSETYYGTEVRRDIVVDGGSYYVTKNELNGSFDGIPTSNTAYWASFGANFESVATGLLLAEEANVAGFSFKGQKLVSQNGYAGGSTSTNPSDIGFEPNLSLDGITGTIHAVQGSIGGFELTKNYLQSVGKDAAGNRNLILNGTTGALKAHGTGDLAGGNIKWDSSGKVTFGPNVTLSWSNIPDAPTIPDGVDDDYIKDLIDGAYIKSTISDSYITGVVNDSYIKNIISDDFIKATFEEAIETDFTTKITSKYITTQHISTLGITSLGKVIAGSFSLGNNNFVVDSDGNLTAKDADITGKITATSGKFTGEVIATSGKFTGEVIATSGKIAGLNIYNNSISTLNEGMSLITGDNIHISKEEIFLRVYSLDMVDGLVREFGKSVHMDKDKISISGNNRVGSSVQYDSRVRIDRSSVMVEDVMRGEYMEIKADGIYKNGMKIELGGGGGGSGYTHPATHPANIITAGTFAGIVKANNNTSYTTKQVRNMILSTGTAVSSQMANGDIWIKYE